MPGKAPKQYFTVDDIREPQADTPELAPLTPELQRLIASNIVAYTDGVVEWRAGHLEHLARQFAVDAMRTERNYHDDLSVALMYSKELFEGLVQEASSQ